MSGTVLVAGASRGLGLEFVHQYAAAGWQVVAGLRRPASVRLPDGVRAQALDVCDPASIAQLAASLDSPLDRLLICAGAMGAKNAAFTTPAGKDFDQVMRTNVLAPIALIEALAPHMARGGCIAVLTSRMGSIADAESPYALLYRCSKAAANMVVKCASQAYRDDALRIIALHPGWVRTDMGGPEAPLLPPESVVGMRAVIEDSATCPGGGFYNYQGQSLPW